MTILLAIDPVHPEPEKIAVAVDVLEGGGIIAYPTETFYGLGADARKAIAVERIFAVKGRAFHNPVSVIVAKEEDILPLVTRIPDGARVLMKRFWPGPLTIVFEATAAVSGRLTAKTGKIGIRVTSNPIALLLARELGAPLTATSANRSGWPESSTASEVRGALGSLPDLIIDGGKTPGVSGSTIIDVTFLPFRIIREGAVPGILIHSAVDKWVE